MKSPVTMRAGPIPRCPREVVKEFRPSQAVAAASRNLSARRKICIEGIPIYKIKLTVLALHQRHSVSYFSARLPSGGGRSFIRGCERCLQPRSCVFCSCH